MISHLRSSRRRCRTILIGLTAILLSLGCNNSRTRLSSSPGDEWKRLDGIWTATGSRNTIRLDQGRKASIATYDGSLVLARDGGSGVGFRSEAIIFTDSKTGLLGRAVWTDEHGDQVFSELSHSGTLNDNVITGNIIGGTGRYAGVNGSYQFAWRFLIENEEGVVQGQSVGLKGRFRITQEQTSGEGL